jgi:hypothetical protein
VIQALPQSQTLGPQASHRCRTRFGCCSHRGIRGVGDRRCPWCFGVPCGAGYSHRSGQRRCFVLRANTASKAAAIAGIHTWASDSKVRATAHAWQQIPGNYSISGVFFNGKGQLVAGNDVANLLFGNASEGTAGLAVSEGGSRAFTAGVGTAMTAGRRTASITSLNP